jgi:hypothetical protein
MHEKFRYRTYSKGELAQLYYPHLAPESARKRLYRWIADDKSLREALAETGYSIHTRTFTPRQVRLLVEHMGEPETW